jgi:hypothetical protein
MLPLFGRVIVLKNDDSIIIPATIVCVITDMAIYENAVLIPKANRVIIVKNCVKTNAGNKVAAKNKIFSLISILVLAAIASEVKKMKYMH